MLKSVEDVSQSSKGDVAFERPQPRARSRRRIGVLALKALLQALIALAVLGLAYQGMSRLILAKDPVPVRQARETTYIVEFQPIEIRDHTPLLSLYGEVLAARTAELRTLVAGEIVRVNPLLETGSVIAAGEELVAIDRFQYEGAVTEARANLAEARAVLAEARGRVATEEGNVERVREQLAFAERDLERASQLRDSGAVTERTLDERRLLVSQRAQALEQRRNALTVETARVTQQEAAIERLEWRLEQAQKNLDDTVLKAPFSAVVRSENAAIGRIVGVNDVVATLYDRDALEVRLTLSDNQYGRILADSGTVVGRPVEVLWYIGGTPVTYSGEIRRIGADVALQRGGIDVYAHVTVAEGQTVLRPGAFVEVRLDDRTYPGTARIPEGALYGTDHVFVAVDGRTVRRDVEVVAFDGTDLIVRGDLQDGDRLVATRLDQAGEGILVAGPSNRAPAGGGPAPAGETRSGGNQ